MYITSTKTVKKKDSFILKESYDSKGYDSSVFKKKKTSTHLK